MFSPLFFGTCSNWQIHAETAAQNVVLLGEGEVILYSVLLGQANIRKQLQWCAKLVLWDNVVTITLRVVMFVLLYVCAATANGRLDFQGHS